MEDNQATVTVYDSNDRILLACSLFELIYGDHALLPGRASYARVNALMGAMVFDVEAPRQPKQ